MRSRRRPALLLLTLLLAGCSGVDGLSADAPRLSDAERESVQVQVEKALEQKRFNLAWNQEVKAGADRGRLERIALEALRARSGHAEDMFSALREKHGALSADSRKAVTLQREAAQREGRWSRALEIEMLTADDPPAYSAAWSVYRDAPPDVAPDLLTTITDARSDHEESSD